MVEDAKNRGVGYHLGPRDSVFGRGVLWRDARELSAGRAIGAGYEEGWPECGAPRVQGDGAQPKGAKGGRREWNQGGGWERADLTLRRRCERYRPGRGTDRRMERGGDRRVQDLKGLCRIGRLKCRRRCVDDSWDVGRRVAGNLTRGRASYSISHSVRLLRVGRTLFTYHYVRRASTRRRNLLGWGRRSYQGRRANGAVIQVRGYRVLVVRKEGDRFVLPTNHVLRAFCLRLRIRVRQRVHADRRRYLVVGRSTRVTVRASAYLFRAIGHATRIFERVSSTVGFAPTRRFLYLFRVSHYARRRRVQSNVSAAYGIATRLEVKAVRRRDEGFVGHLAHVSGNVRWEVGRERWSGGCRYALIASGAYRFLSPRGRDVRCNFTRRFPPLFCYSRYDARTVWSGSDVALHGHYADDGNGVAGGGEGT